MCATADRQGVSHFGISVSFEHEDFLIDGKSMMVLGVLDLCC